MAQHSRAQSDETVPYGRPSVSVDPRHLPLVLVGLPGSGKTTVARLLASALGVQVTDTDAEIRRRARMTIPEIFAVESEDGFRDRETRAIRAVLESPAGALGVVALGGGAILREENRRMLRGRTVVHLSATPETAAFHVGDGAGRPLMSPGADADEVEGDLELRSAADARAAVLARMEALHAQRAPLYAEVATITVPTDGLTPQQIAALVLVSLGAEAPVAARALTDRAGRQTAAPEGAAEGRADDTIVLPEPTALAPDADGRVRIGVGGSAPYSVVIGHGLADEVVAATTRAPGRGAGGVAIVHAPELGGRAATYERALRDAGLRVSRVLVPAGEAGKTAAVLESVWEGLGAARIGRDGCVIGVGGGATTDLAGFAAATWLRGVPVIQVPTSLLAMVDAAVGGKTGINTATGKNLAGAFHAPSAVVCDLESLGTLPAAELRAGLGEVVKCGFISDPVILDRVLADPADVGDWDSPVLAELVARSIAVKAAVVARDLKESGLREVLNYGHTLAHAIETLSDYRWRHGEAVAVGCVFAAEVARAAGRIGEDLVALHREAFGAVGLPTAFTEGADRFEEMLSIMRSDKKVRAGAIRMVLLDGVAKPVLGATPSDELLRAAHAAVTSGTASASGRTSA